MKKHGKKVLSLLLAGAMLWSSAIPALAFGENAEPMNDDIVVLFTNDVHCTSDEGMSYAAVAGYKEQMESAYGADNVTLVDNGDAIQGAVLGTLSDGEWIVDIMNEVGYDFAVPGNHEFDFGMDQFLDIANHQADYQYLSCNFLDKDGNQVLDPYAIVDYGDVQIAYVGISTPETLSKSTPFISRMTMATTFMISAKEITARNCTIACRILSMKRALKGPIMLLLWRIWEKIF